MTTPAYQNDAVTVYLGDCLDILPELADNSVDSVVTDPPYGLEFMGKDWDSFDDKRTKWRDGSESEADAAYLADHASAFTKRFRRTPDAYVAGSAFQSWCQQWAAQCLRVLKPGGHLLAFGGTRTWHRLACAIEDAGFEIRDSIGWLYGSGFPKNLDVSKAIDKAAGAEREVVGAGGHSGMTRNSMAGDFSGSWDTTSPATDAAARWQGWGTALKPAHEPIVVARKPLQGTVAQNVLEHGCGALNIDACRVATDEDTRRPFGTPSDHVGQLKGLPHGELNPGSTLGRWPTNVAIDPHTATQIDKQSGHTISGKPRRERGTGGIWSNGDGVLCGPQHGDSGGASRFFPTFKYEPKAPTLERPNADGATHPTVKPLDLMRWLIRLVTPPHGLVLDPFAGSGTTAEAAIHEHMRCVTIEREADYLPIITARLHKPIQIGFDYDEVPF